MDSASCTWPSSAWAQRVTHCSTGASETLLKRWTSFVWKGQSVSTFWQFTPFGYGVLFDPGLHRTSWLQWSRLQFLRLLGLLWFDSSKQQIWASLGSISMTCKWIKIVKEYLSFFPLAVLVHWKLQQCIFHLPLLRFRLRSCLSGVSSLAGNRLFVIGWCALLVSILLCAVYTIQSAALFCHRREIQVGQLGRISCVALDLSFGLCFLQTSAAWGTSLHSNICFPDWILKFFALSLFCWASFTFKTLT